MSLVFAVEKWEAVQPEIAQLIPFHWKEVALNHNEVPLDPAWDRYAALDKGNSLHTVSVRFKGKFIGYHIAIVTGHLHYKDTIHYITDVYYILPEYRTGFVGLKLFKFVEQEARALGCKKMISATKKHLEMGAIFFRCGWKPVETMYAKILR